MRQTGSSSSSLRPREVRFVPPDNQVALGETRTEASAETKTGVHAEDFAIREVLRYQPKNRNATAITGWRRGKKNQTKRTSFVNPGREWMILGVLRGVRYGDSIGWVVLAKMFQSD